MCNGEKKWKRKLLRRTPVWSGSITRIASFPSKRQKALSRSPLPLPMSGLHTLLKSARADIACSKKPHSKQMTLKGANMMNKLISYFGTFTPGADGAVGAFQFEYLTSLGFAALVIFAGRAIVRRSHVLRKFAIPAPVISGLLFSVLIAIFKGTGILAISFDTNVSQRSATIVSCMSMRWGGLTVTFPLRLISASVA